MLVRPYCPSSALPKHILFLAKEEKSRDKTSHAKIFGFGQNILLKIVYGITLGICSNCTGCGFTLTISCGRQPCQVHVAWARVQAALFDRL